MSGAGPWDDGAGVVTLPGGARVRGRRLGAEAQPADLTVVLGSGPLPPWPHRQVRWPDFWVPTDPADALDALREAHRRAYAGERVEVGCSGGIGRTGTALAALAVLDGLPADDAVRWVRAGYHPRAVETPWQRRWLRSIRPASPSGGVGRTGPS
ncbi:protein-tyrosine phosphatase family protein [Geodermatophilus sp. SYSU D00705]